MPSSLLSSCRLKLGLVSVEPVMFLYQLSVFTQFGVMQDLIYTKVCLNSKYKDFCSNLTDSALDYVQQEGSYWMLYNSIALFIPSTLSSLYLGSWCSLYGSKFPMLLSALGAVFANLINTAISVYMDTSIAYILAGQILQGFFGAGICLTMATMTHVSNISSIQSRTARMGVLESMLSFGATIGPFIGGTMLKNTNHASVFLFLMAINATVIIYILIFIKSNQTTMSREQQQQEEEEEEKEEPVNPMDVSPPTAKYLFGIQHALRTLETCFRSRENDKQKTILLLILAASFCITCTAGELDTTYLFAKDEPLFWNYDFYSYYYGFKMGVRGLGLIFILPLIKRFWNFTDVTYCILSVLSHMAGLVFLSFSTTTASMFCVPLFAIVSGFVPSTIRSMLSKLTEKTEHGKVFASIAIVENLCFLIASVTFNKVYPMGRKIIHGFVFLLLAGLEIIPTIIFLYLLRAYKKRQGNDSSSPNYETL